MPINDLTETDPIVDPETGRPTPYFMRMIMDRGTLQLTTEEQVALLNALEIIAGAGLDGGGILGDGANITLDANASAILDLITSTRGSILYRGASAWAGLAPGTSGHFLKSNGAGADPSYAAASGGSAAWASVDSWSFTIDGSFATRDVDVSAYNDLRVVGRDITQSAAQWRSFRLSVDGGSTFISTADYILLSDTGTRTISDTEGFFHSTSSSAARDIWGSFIGLQGGYPQWTAPRSSGSRLCYLNNSSPVTHIRMMAPDGTTTWTGGFYEIWGR